MPPKPRVTLLREGELKVDSKGKQYVSPDDGYAILFPPGAIPESQTVIFKHGVIPPFGPFEFPDGVRPVSAILSLHQTTDQQLLKPIDIALPHFIHCETQDDRNRLAVFKANCDSDGQDGKQIYHFKEMPDQNLSLGTYYEDPKYPEGIPYAKYSTDHLCYWCIGEYGKEDTDRAIFSLIEAKPKVMLQDQDPVVHFCLPYFLPTCLKTTREQYPEEEYELSIQSVKFSHDSHDEPAIGIEFQENLGDWLFSLQGGKDKKIYLEDVCFWDYPTPLYLKEMCEEKLYPPRFTIRIRNMHGVARPNDVVRAEFTFPGAVTFPGRSRGEPRAIIHLPLPAQIPRSSLSLGVPISRVNSNHSATSETVFRAPPVNQPPAAVARSSSQQGLLSAAKAFKACMCDLDDLHPSKLAINLFSKEVIDEAEFTSIQESMKSTTKDEMVICNEILFKVYNALKVDVAVYAPLQEVLTKLKPETARKLKSEMERLSRSCSLASSTSLATAPEKMSNEAETTAEIASEDHNTVHIVNGSPHTSPTLTEYSQIQFGEGVMGALIFNTQTSQAPADSSSMAVEPVAESEEESTTHQAAVVASIYNQ